MLQTIKSLVCAALLITCSGLVAEDGQTGSVGEGQIRSISAPWFVGPDGGISADGRWLSFTDWTDGNLALFETNTSEIRYLTDKGSWSDSFEFASTSAVSPDGSHVAYNWWTRKFAFELRITGEGKSQSRVIYHPDEVFDKEPIPHCWSPDGQHVAVAVRTGANAYNIALITVKNGSRKTLGSIAAHSIGRMAFSPSGEYLAFEARTGERTPHRKLFLLSGDGVQHEVLSSPSADDQLLGWSPGGDSIAYVSDRDGTLDLWVHPIHEGVPGASSRHVWQRLGSEIDPLGIAADGSIYFSTLERRDDLYLARFNADRTRLEAPEILTHGVAPFIAPDWSPDGKLLSYLSYQGSDPLVSFASIPVFRSLVDGGERRLPAWEDRRSTIGAGVVTQPLWAPDGKFVMLLGSGGMSLLDTDTGARRTIGEPRGWFSWIGAWSDDAQSVFRLREDQVWSNLPGNDSIGRWTILRQDLNTGIETELASYPFVPHPEQAMSLSPDGRRLAFLGGSLAPNTDVAIYVMPVDGGPADPLYQVSYPDLLLGLDWSADGRDLIFGATNTGSGLDEFELWSVAASGGRPKSLGLKMEGVRLIGLSVHPRGEYIAFTAGASPNREIRVVEGLFQRSMSP